MEIDITAFVQNADPYEFSASVAERGENAGRVTWNNAKAEGAASPLLKPEQLDEFRDYMRGFGAWEREEIDGWSADECNALFIQLVSGDMREIGLDEGDLDAFDWHEYELRAAMGSVPGNLFRADDGRIFYYVGN